MSCIFQMFNFLPPMLVSTALLGDAAPSSSLAVAGFSAWE